MQTKGKSTKFVRQFSLDTGTIGYRNQDDAVLNKSLHSGLKTPLKLHVEGDLQNRCEKQHSPFAKIVSLGEGDLQVKEKIVCTNNNETSTSEMHDKVREILALYRDELHKLKRENAKSVGRMSNIHQEAASNLQKKGVNFLNQDKQIGDVPGIEIGNEFGTRAELYITGLHLQFSKGIDYMLKDGTLLATSVVESSRYPNTVNKYGDLIYVGEGGNPKVSSRCRVKNQEMERGNLALMKSQIRNSPIRVIRKDTLQKLPCYVYDGLYLVLKHWKERGPYNKYIYKFQLRRLSEQPSPRGFPWNSNEFLLQEHGITNKDLSRGKEKFPIVVVNKIDDQKLAKFTYISKPLLANKSYLCGGCDCEDGCSDTEDCSCKSKNGGKLIYDYDQCITIRSSSILECGPYCKCFESCLSKVSQRGIQFELEVFKVDSKRWGVRSRKNIPSGGFVCEYVGEIVRFKAGDLNGIADNEYLFVVGYDNKDCSSGDDEVLAIDARHRGNVGRFIRRSCSPNLFVQKAYISPDVRIPHILLFALKDISPLEELTYDYNWWLES